MGSSPVSLPLTDGYAQWYADRIWKLVPAVYKSLDQGPSPGAPGPLQELVNRIGAQAAVVRRSIDRMGENQSIETCDDWVIPYIGDLVATRLVSCLDAAAQRIDVAKTIYYRRRAGTVGLLEELAADIATHDARVVEFFRRLGRTRHQFDPPLSYAIENPLDGPVGFSDSSLEVDEGLLGAYSGTPAGGFADLRNSYAASKTGTAFDEYAYTADLRLGSQATGWYNIRHLGVFVWWLYSFPIEGATPVTNGTCFTFDPTGRDAPLFAASERAEHPRSSWGEDWKSPDEWTLPVPISELLWDLVPDQLFGQSNSFQVDTVAGNTSTPVDPATLLCHPQTGRFSFKPGTMPVGTLEVGYHFGLMSQIGAGAFDEAILTSLDQPAPTTKISGGGSLNTALSAVSGDVTLLFGDSMTYPGPTQALTVGDGNTVCVRGAGDQRPVWRWAPPGPPPAVPVANTASWTIISNKTPTGGATVLILQGILLQGADVVIQGNFDAVYLRMMTLDPGTAGAAPAFYGTAIDEMELSGLTLWIEGVVTQLVVERSITGPIRTRNGGTIGQLTATDSILQSIPTHAVVAGTKPTSSTVIFDPVSLAGDLANQTSKLAKQVFDSSNELQSELIAYEKNKATTPLVPSALLTLMQTAIETVDVVAAEKAWPVALADLALGCGSGVVSLSRCTVLGPTYTARLSASECILDDVATVEDAQDGCVRFTAYARGSKLHQPYRSVTVAPHAPLFVSRAFGMPDYARLRSDADAQIIAGQGGTSCGSTEPDVKASILEGAQNGAEMGAYCLEAVALKRQGLAFKFQEYAPIGQLPVWIDAD
jgi:hypothetical protein